MRHTHWVCIAVLCLLFSATECAANKHRVEVARRHKNACKLNCVYVNRKNRCRTKFQKQYQYKYYSRPYSREYLAKRHYYYTPYYDPYYYYYNDCQPKSGYFFRFSN